VEQNQGLFDNPEDMPRRAFTMGVGTILDARRIVLLATGKEKAEIIAKAIEGPVTSMISASALQLHPKTVIILDEGAASELTEKEYYRWIFENEPEWREFH
jgi:glucosamine-6-phosphate deaminase